MSFGGQTALNCGIQLDKQGILSKYNVKVLGTKIRGIENTEDRDLFKQKMTESGIDTPKSRAVYSIEEAKELVEELGYPVMIKVLHVAGGGNIAPTYKQNHAEHYNMKQEVLDYIEFLKENPN